MPLHVRSSGVWPIATLWLKHAGVWRMAIEGYIKHAGAWLPFLTSMTVTAPNIDEFASGDTPTGNVVGSSTATVTGSNGAVLYSWARISGDSNQGAAITNQQTVQIGATLSSGVPSTAVWRVTVTDIASGATAFYDITCTLNYLNTG